MTLAALAFWLSLAAIAFAYGGYVLVILALALVVRRPVRKAPCEPSVTLLITAYNEEQDIARKLEQSLQLDYPPDRLEILVASDGSTDGTDDIVRNFAARGVRLVRVEGRVGKTETQNRAVLEARGDIVVFSDATTRYVPEAIRMLVRNFSDPQVGAVSGRYSYENSQGATIGLGSVLFSRFDNAVRGLQSQVYAITGCSGCMYAVRRDLYRPLPPDIISDLCEPLKVLAGGHRVVFEPDAMAFEETTRRTREEFRMRVRVILRGMRGLVYMRELFHPLRHPFVSFQLLSHKILRWSVSVFLAAMLVSCAVLAGAHPFYRGMLVAQLAFYAVAAFGAFAEHRRWRVGPLAIPLYFVTVNAAAVLAFVRLLKGQQAVTWNTARQS